jgi:hypothetical protein
VGGKMNLNRDKNFEVRLFLKRVDFRKEDHAPRHPAKQAMLDEMYVAKARGACMLRISDDEYVCREVFQERLDSGTLPDNEWVKKSRIKFEKFDRQPNNGTKDRKCPQNVQNVAFP